MPRSPSIERPPSRIGDLHANDVNRPFDSSACFAPGRETVSEQASEQGFADATCKQIRLGVPVSGFREEPERAPAATFAEQDRSFHGRPLRPPPKYRNKET